MAVSLEDAVKRRLQAVPEAPGVYLFRDNRSQVIYVGKALRLRDRLRSYFTPGNAQTARVAELIRKATPTRLVFRAQALRVAAFGELTGKRRHADGLRVIRLAT